MSAARWNGTELTLDLHVQPGAAHDEFCGLHGERLKLRITAPPVEGRANRHLIAYLANAFDVPRTRIRLVRGASGRSKTICIESPAQIPHEVALTLGSKPAAR